MLSLMPYARGMAAAFSRSFSLFLSEKWTHFNTIVLGKCFGTRSQGKSGDLDGRWCAEELRGILKCVGRILKGVG